MIVSQRVLDLGLGLHIHRAGAVVQDQDLGLRDQGAGDGDALLLPARQVDSALFDVGVVALRQLEDELVRLGRSGGGDHLFVAGLRAPIADVIAHRAGEQDRLLRHDADLRQQRILLDGADIDPVDQDLPCGGIVEARDQVDQRGFARAGRAQDGDRLARLGRQVDRVQHGGIAAAVVVEADVLEVHPRLGCLGQQAGAGHILHFGTAYPAPR